MKQTITESESFEIMGLYLMLRRNYSENDFLTRQLRKLLEIENNTSSSACDWIIQYSWGDEPEMNYAEFKKFLVNKCELKIEGDVKE